MILDTGEGSIVLDFTYSEKEKLLGVYGFQIND